MLDRIRELRIYEDYSMNEVAKKMQISKSTYQMIENQRDIPSLTRLLQLANIYHVSINYLLGFEDNQRKCINNYSINNEIIGEKIKAIRNDLGLSQKDFAKRLHIGRSTLSNYETQKLKLSTTVLYEICKQFKIDADYILGYSNHKTL